MDDSYKSRTISQLVAELALRLKDADRRQAPEEELASLLLGFIWLTDNTNELVYAYPLLGDIEELVSNMDWQEYYQTPEFRRQLKEMITELERQVTDAA